MFVVTEAEAAAIRAVYQQRGEFAAAIELRRRFPGITDNALARMWPRTIAGWKPSAAGEADAETAAVTAGALTGLATGAGAVLAAPRSTSGGASASTRR
jgi:hypothetical protein